MNKEKTKLVWRLERLPSVDEIDKLVKSEVLTKDEARQILFNTEEERDVKGLKEEIKFLRNLVDKLSERNNQVIVEKIKEIEIPVYKKYPWYEPYKYWCSSMTSTTDSPLMQLQVVEEGAATFAYNASTDKNLSFQNIKTF